MWCKGNNFSGKYTKFVGLLKKFNYYGTHLQCPAAERDLYRAHGRHPAGSTARGTRGRRIRCHDRPALPPDAGSLRYGADRPRGEYKDPANRRIDLPPLHRTGRRPVDFRAGDRGRYRDRRDGFRRRDLHARPRFRLRLDDPAGAGRRQRGRQERRECRRIQRIWRGRFRSPVRGLRPRDAAHALRPGVPRRAGRSRQGGRHRRCRPFRAYRSHDFRRPAFRHRPAYGCRFGVDPREGRYRRTRRARVGRPPQAQPPAYAGARHREMYQPSEPRRGRGGGHGADRRCLGEARCTGGEDRDRIAGVLKKLGFDLTPPVDVKRLLEGGGQGQEERRRYAAYRGAGRHRRLRRAPDVARRVCGAVCVTRSVNYRAVKTPGRKPGVFIARYPSGTIPRSASGVFRYRRPNRRWAAVRRRSIAARATAGATVHNSLGSNGFGNQVVAAEFEFFERIGPQHHCRYRFLGQLGERMCRGKFHRFVDLRGPDIERPAEDGETPARC